MNEAHPIAGESAFLPTTLVTAAAASTRIRVTRRRVALIR